MKKYDLLITGCGFSSIFGAREAVRHGLNILVVEKSIDISYPPSGSMFISSDTYEKYFSAYGSYLNGRFNMITIRSENFENDYLLERGKEIISVDREKIIRHMCADLAGSGLEIRIKSSIEGIQDMGDRFRITGMIEGKIEEFEVEKIAFGDGNARNKQIIHRDGCTFHSYTSSYSRSISPRKLDARFVSGLLGDQNYLIEADIGKNVETLGVGLDTGVARGNVAHFRYNGEIHTCFPEYRKGMAFLGNMTGSTRILGIPVRHAIELSVDAMNNLIEDAGPEGNMRLEEKWRMLDESWKNADLDPIDSIRERIPVGI